MLPWFHLFLLVVAFGSGTASAATAAATADFSTLKAASTATPKMITTTRDYYTSRHRALSFSERSVRERQHFAKTAPSSMTVELFDRAAPLSQFSPRVNINETIPSLPFGDGPGVMPAFPVATRDFWFGNGPPVQAWEFLACPILVRLLPVVLAVVVVVVVIRLHH